MAKVCYFKSKDANVVTLVEVRKTLHLTVFDNKSLEKLIKLTKSLDKILGTPASNIFKSKSLVRKSILTDFNCHLIQILSVVITAKLTVVDKLLWKIIFKNLQFKLPDLSLCSYSQTKILF